MPPAFAGGSSYSGDLPPLPDDLLEGVDPRAALPARVAAEHALDLQQEISGALDPVVPAGAVAQRERALLALGEQAGRRVRVDRRAGHDAADVERAAAEFGVAVGLVNDDPAARGEPAGGDDDLVLRRR